MDFADPFLLYHKANTSLTYRPDAEVESSKVCNEWLTMDECARWRSCCQSARACCLDVQKEGPDAMSGGGQCEII